jgi:hypothetical protein
MNLFEVQFPSTTSIYSGAKFQVLLADLDEPEVSLVFEFMEDSDSVLRFNLACNVDGITVCIRSGFVDACVLDISYTPGK